MLTYILLQNNNDNCTRVFAFNIHLKISHRDRQGVFFFRCWLELFRPHIFRKKIDFILEVLQRNHSRIVNFNQNVISSWNNFGRFTTNLTEMRIYQIVLPGWKVILRKKLKFGPLRHVLISSYISGSFTDYDTTMIKYQMIHFTARPIETHS